MKPDFLVRAPEGIQDIIIKRLVKNGLKILGSLELARLAGHWTKEKAPDFLTNGGNIEMFELLGILNIATYRKLGQAKYNLRNVIDIFEKEYDLGQNFIPNDWESIINAANIASIDDEIPRHAIFDAYITSLVSALDSLAAEITMLLNLKYSIWNVHFSNVVREFRNWSISDNLSDRNIIFNKFKNLFNQFLLMEGSLADWFEQLLQYRHAAAHRSHLMWTVEVVPLRKYQIRLDHHLYLNTYARTSETIPSPNPVGISQKEVNDVMSKFQEWTVSQYCDWIFKHVVAFVSKIYEVLVDIYKARAQNSSLFKNNPEILLKRGQCQQQTRFRGLSD